MYLSDYQSLDEAREQLGRFIDQVYAHERRSQRAGLCDAGGTRGRVAGKHPLRFWYFVSSFVGPLHPAPSPRRQGAGANVERSFAYIGGPREAASLQTRDQNSVSSVYSVVKKPVTCRPAPSPQPHPRPTPPPALFAPVFGGAGIPKRWEGELRSAGNGQTGSADPLSFPADDSSPNARRQPHARGVFPGGSAPSHAGSAYESGSRKADPAGWAPRLPG